MSASCSTLTGDILPARMAVDGAHNSLVASVSVSSLSSVTRENEVTNSFRLHPGGDVDKIFKVILVGEQHTGKTSLFLRLCGRDISAASCTPGLDFVSITRTVGGMPITVHYFDTAGLDTRQYSMSRQFYRNSAAVLYVYSTLEETTLSDLAHWGGEVAGQCSAPYVTFLVGTRSDLAVEDKSSHVSADTATCFADGLGCAGSHRVSSRTGDGVEELLMDVAVHLKRMYTGRPADVPWQAEGGNAAESNGCAC